MSDKSLMPVSDEVAKLGRALVEAAGQTAGYLADILDDLPKDLVGLLAGDKVKVRRAQRLAVLWADASARLRDGGILTPEPPSLKFALPILEAAADENRKELRDLWARLLAAAMNPQKQDLLRQSFISAVKGMDTHDTLVFRAVIENGNAAWTPNGRDFIATKLNLETAEVVVSLENLHKSGCVSFSGQVSALNPYPSAFGQLLAKAIA